MKKTLAMLMAIVMMASMFVMPTQADEEFFELSDEFVFEELSTPVNAGYDTIVDEPGMCGPNATWEIIYGCLFISGSGAMYDYNAGEAPWCSVNTEIYGLSVSGISYIGANAFAGMTFGWAELNECTTGIGDGAFAGCSNLNSIYFNGHENTWNALAAQSGVLSAIEPMINVPPLGYGETDNGIFWTISEDGDMEFLGLGIIPDYQYGQAPWFALAEYVQNISVSLGVSHIGANAFNGMTNLNAVYVENFEIEVDNDAFVGANPDAFIAYPVMDDGDWNYVELVIHDNPVSCTVNAGETAHFEIYAEGMDIVYTWLKSDDGITWEEIENSNSSSLSFIATAADNYTYYRCAVSDGDNELVSDVAALTVRVPLVVISQPVDTEIKTGSKAQLTFDVSGEGLTYRWQYSINGRTWYTLGGVGANTASLTVSGIATNNGNYYRCVVTDYRKNTVTSDPVIVTVVAADPGPVIISNPYNVTAKSGSKAVFRVTATGDGLTYRWQVSSNGGRSWGSVTSSGYSTNAITVTASSVNAGKLYRCKITDSAGYIVYTDAAMLTVK